MAIATINVSLDEDLLNQIDYFADNESLTRTDLIYNSLKMYINRKKRLQELYMYGESVARKNNFTEDNVMEEIKNYRKTKKARPPRGISVCTPLI
jgi:metal-responsive CopG/Arc/MetJ family transcriptional regulator